MQNKHAMSYMDATGVIEYKMTNNYMFRFILQKNQKVLKGLIASLLHLNPTEIKKVEIRNPINLAGDVSGKEFILDIEVMLNNDTLINLEMQVANEHNWPERSLSYACRSFDNLFQSQKYEEAIQVIHIGFLEFTLFEDAPEFYSEFNMINVKNHRIYSDKFILRVVDLTKINLVTEEDKVFQIDYWARLFKAKTWEELKMLAKDNDYLQEAAESLYIANADEIVRQQCRAREDAERRERTLVRNLRIAEEKIAKQDEQLTENVKELAEKDKLIQELQLKLSKLQHMD